MAYSAAQPTHGYVLGRIPTCNNDPLLLHVLHIPAVDHCPPPLTTIYRPFRLPIFIGHSTFPFHFSFRFRFWDPFSHLRPPNIFPSDNYTLYTYSLTRFIVAYLWFKNCHCTHPRLAPLCNHYPSHCFLFKNRGKYVFYLVFFFFFPNLSWRNESFLFNPSSPQFKRTNFVILKLHYSTQIQKITQYTFPSLLIFYLIFFIFPIKSKFSMETNTHTHTKKKTKTWLKKKWHPPLYNNS